MCGAVVWLKGGVRNHHHLRVGCFTITLMTVVSQSPKSTVDVNSKHFPYRFFSVLLWTWLSSIPSWPTPVSNRETSVVFMWASCVMSIQNLCSYHNTKQLGCVFTFSNSAVLCLQMVQQRSASVHVWSPLCSFTAYFIAWYSLVFPIFIFCHQYCRVLPVPLIMIPFGVIAQQYKIVEKADSCSCW